MRTTFHIFLKYVLKRIRNRTKGIIGIKKEVKKKSIHQTGAPF